MGGRLMLLGYQDAPNNREKKLRSVGVLDKNSTEKGISAQGIKHIRKKFLSHFSGVCAEAIRRLNIFSSFIFFCLF
jgi:hypothetical protein